MAYSISRCVIDGAVESLRRQELQIGDDYPNKMKAIGQNIRLVWILLVSERG